MPQKTLPDNNLTPQERNKLVEDNINLARYLAHKLCKDPQLMDDCIQEGCAGLMRAARLFDASRDNKFTSFASFEIQCAIREFLYRNRLIRLPDDQRNQINRYKTMVSQYEHDNIEVTSELLLKTASEVGISKEVHNQLLSPISSLNVKLSAEKSDESAEVGDLIADTVMEDPIDNIAYSELVEFINNFIENAKIADEKTKRIVITQMRQLILNAAGEDPKNTKTLTQLVSEAYPELDLKSIEFDRNYTRISSVWRTQLNKLRKIIRSEAAYI